MVRLGKGCRFIGKTYFRRFPGSKISIGEGCTFRSIPVSNPSGINRPCILTTLSKGAAIEIGNSCGFSGTTIVSESRIIIGSRVRCSPNTWIIDTDGHGDDPRVTPSAPICIESGVWLGANVSVLKGVTIGENTLVAAGSIVTRSLPAGVVAGGVPAKILREIKCLHDREESNGENQC